MPLESAKQFFQSQGHSQKIFKQNLRNHTSAKFTKVWKNENIEIVSDTAWFENVTETPNSAKHPKFFSNGSEIFCQLPNK